MVCTLKLESDLGEEVRQGLDLLLEVEVALGELLVDLDIEKNDSISASQPSSFPDTALAEENHTLPW